jgi:hypothetical protein
MRCEKKGFKSYDAAIKFGRHRNPGQKRTWLSKVAGRVRAYFCHECKLFHVTTKMNGRRK